MSSWSRAGRLPGGTARIAFPGGDIEAHPRPGPGARDRDSSLDPPATRALLAARVTGICHALSEIRLLELSGPDAASYLNAMATRDLAGLAAGRILYAALADDRGRYVADFWVWRLGSRWLLECAATVSEALARRLSGFAVADDVEVRDRTEERALFHFEGPQAERALRKLGLVPGEDEAISEVGRVPEWASEPVWLARRSRFGESGWTVAVAPADRAAFEAARVPAASSAGLVEAPPPAREALRIESGRPLGGVDLRETDLIQEAGLLEAVSLDKGCYPGQEVLQRVARRGRVRRRLVGLRLPAEAATVEWSGAEVQDPERRAIGQVTSAAFSPGLDAVLALAWLDAGMAPGSLVGLRREPSASPLPGGVEALPFVSGSIGALPETPRYPEEDGTVR